MKRMFFHLFVSITFITVSVVVAVAATTLNYEYDANGNLVRGEGKYYEYNDANQLVRVRHNDASGAVLAEYVYDYNGQRIKKVESGVTTYYIGKYYETQVTDDSQTKTSYYFANGERVAKKDTTGKLSYYHSDHLGGTNVVTDASGALVERTKYYPFGEIREGGSEKYSYTGKEKDKSTDWYYYEARYYNPQIKHFTQVDNVESNYFAPQDLNKYVYVINNPIRMIDSTGHRSEDSKLDMNKLGKELIKFGLEVTNKKIVYVKGYLKNGKYVKSYWRRAPNAVKSGASQLSQFKLLIDPILEANNILNRNDLKLGQKIGRYSFSIIDGAIPGFSELAEALCGGSESYDQAKTDFFSNKNKAVDMLSDTMRRAGGEKFDNWLIDQNWLDY